MTDAELSALERVLKNMLHGKSVLSKTQAIKPEGVLELIAELRKRTALLEEIYSDIGEKVGGACNVCSTYTHKHWCYYPRLAQILGKPLDEFDTKFLAAKEATC